VQGLTDRSRRPYRYANQLPFQVENYILNEKRQHPSWGARKIRERLLRRFSGIPIPAKTVTDHASRYLLTCEALCSTKEAYAFTIFERLFKERGLPAHIRSDNGVPFAPRTHYLI